MTQHRLFTSLSPRRRAFTLVAATSLLALVTLPSSLAGANAQAPAGNNGHIQIDENPLDGGMGNDPHLACGFSVSFFGFDAGAQQATITVTPVAPTTGGTALTQATSWNIARRTSGNQLDANVVISPASLAAAFAGVTPAHEGYHARVTVDVSGSIGADSKTHTIWIAPCPAPVAPPTTSSGSGSGTGSGTGTGSDNGTTTTTTTTTTVVTPPASVVAGAPATAALGAGTVTFRKYQRVGGTTNPFVASTIHVLVGEQIQYQLVLTNTSGAPLSLVVSDPLCDAGTLTPTGAQMVAAGATVNFFCSHHVTTEPANAMFENVAEAVATSASAQSTGPIFSGVLADVSAPSVSAKKLAVSPVATAQLQSANFTG